MFHFTLLFIGPVFHLASVSEEGNLNRAHGALQSTKKGQDLTMTIPEKQKTTKSR